MFHNTAKWYLCIHNRHKWNVSTAYLRHVQAQPAQGRWRDSLVGRFGARQCCSGTRIWFRACMATLYAAPERRGSTMSACSRGTGTRRVAAATGLGLARSHRDSSGLEPHRCRLGEEPTARVLRDALRAADCGSRTHTVKRPTRSTAGCLRRRLRSPRLAMALWPYPLVVV